MKTKKLRWCAHAEQRADSVALFSGSCVRITTCSRLPRSVACCSGVPVNLKELALDRLTLAPGPLLDHEHRAELA